MPQATHADVRLLAAWIATPSTKQAAHSLGMTDAAYRHRLRRMFRRFGVHSMAALIHALGPDVAQTAQWTADDLADTIAG